MQMTHLSNYRVVFLDDISLLMVDTGHLNWTAKNG